MSHVRYSFLGPANRVCREAQENCVCNFRKSYLPELEIFSGKNVKIGNLFATTTIFFLMNMVVSRPKN